MIKFCFRTQFAGIDVPAKVNKASDRIVKKYKSFRATDAGDKATYCEMNDAEFAAMVREHKAAGLDYLIEIEGQDYTAW